MKYNRNKKRKKVIISIFFFAALLVGLFCFYGSHTLEEIYLNSENEKKKIELEQLSEKLENVERKTYYISETGTSTNGLDINNPMSLQEARKKTYYGNEKILFKCGDTFYGKVSFNIKAQDGTLCYIGSYGEGEPPKISGAKIIENQYVWQLQPDTLDIYKVDLTNRDNFKGVDAVDKDSCNIGFIVDSAGNIYGKRKEHLSDLVEENDFYCDNTYLYIKCSNNPNKKLGTLKLATKSLLFSVSSNCEISGIQLENTGVHGFLKRDYPLNNVYIHDCIIQNIGGSIQYQEKFVRYGNGIEFWNGASNVIIERNIIKNVYDSAITLQGNEGEWNNIIIKENLLIKNCFSFEFWCNNTAKGMQNIEIYKNMSINQGKGWGQKVRINQNNSAELTIYDYTPDIWDLNMYDNTYLNSERLYYVLYKTKDKFKEKVKINNNKIMHSEDIFVVNDNKSDNIREYLAKEYNIDKDSEMKVISQEKVAKISNEKILNANNYNEIKTYYENLEHQFQYTDIANEIIEKYDNFQNKYTEDMQTVPQLGNIIKYLKNSMCQIAEAKKDEKIVEIMKQHYELGNLVVQEYKNTNINYGDTIDILSDLDNFSELYNQCIDIAKENNNVDENIIQEQIKTAENIIEKNADLKTKYAEQLLDKAKQSNELQSQYRVFWSQELMQIQIERHIEEHPVQVYYSEEQLTNQDVKATLQIGIDSKILNNANSNEYIFTQNGSFTFQYERRGKSFIQEVSVNNIDKIPPTVTGVSNGKVYTKAVIPIVKDEHLEKIQLILNGQVVDYMNGTEVKQEGLYNIIATDKAGNRTTVTFEIIDDTNKDYIIKEQTIQNIATSTSKDELNKKLSIKSEYKIMRKNQEIAENETIATGDKLVLSSGEAYTLIVKGDINKTGDIGIVDLVLLRKQVIGDEQFDGEQQLAADINFDEKLNIKDIVKIRQLILDKSD